MATIRWLALGTAIVIVLVLAVLVSFLLEAHIEMRRLTRPLPAREALTSFGVGGPGPSRLRYVGSGMQVRPNGSRSTYGGFVLDWADGRAFAIDLGMSESGMRQFGAVLETVMAADPIETAGSVGSQLGPEQAGRVTGVAFTHLHTDHTEGAIELCGLRKGESLRAFQMPDQFERQNFTTSSGRSDLERAGCIEPVRLDDPGATAGAENPLRPIPGFPGLAAFSVGGHTPGSTAYVARVGDRLFLFAGDITNEHPNLMNNVGKGFVYSYLLIPEATGRLEELRLWLAALHSPPHIEIVVSHDLDAIEAAGIETH